MTDYLILVDENDNEIGTEEKLAAHQHGGQLHRAFSVFVFNNAGEIMLQRRALEKYHCPGLWTNTCCSHPRPGETTLAAATRRLQEEMGFTCSLEEKFTMTYRVDFDNGLTEHEFLHVFKGTYNDIPNLNPAEAMEYMRISPEKLRENIAQTPEKFTPWFRIIIQDHFFKLKN